uniref:Uncharacterized protein n=1 Tax=Strongyloides papillosus TaxID=174720 RepID=A0A0N5BRK8_STREA
MNLNKPIHIFLIIIFAVFVNAVDSYEWDSDRQAAARFLTERIFGAVINYNVSNALMLANNINKFKKKKTGKYNKSIFRKNKWSGISKKILKNTDKYEKTKDLEMKHSGKIYDNIKYTINKKSKSFGNFKSTSFVDQNMIQKPERVSSERFVINHSNSPRGKLIKVEASPFIRELPFEDHDLDIVAPHLAGIKTLIVDEPLELRKTYF